MFIFFSVCGSVLSSLPEPSVPVFVGIGSSISSSTSTCLSIWLHAYLCVCLLVCLLEAVNIKCSLMVCLSVRPSVHLSPSLFFLGWQTGMFIVARPTPNIASQETVFLGMPCRAGLTCVKPSSLIHRIFNVLQK